MGRVWSVLNGRFPTIIHMYFHPNDAKSALNVLGNCPIPEHAFPKSQCLIINVTIYKYRQSQDAIH